MLAAAIKEQKGITSNSLEALIKNHISAKSQSNPVGKMKWDDWIRVSSIPYMCPKHTVWYALSDDIEYSESKIIYEFGNAFQDIVRNNYLAPMGVLLGQWKCKRCQIIRKFDDEAIIHKYPHELDESCTSCNFKGNGGSIYEYHEITLKSDGHRIQGHADGFLNFGHKYELLEIKTANDNSFKMFKKLKTNAPYMDTYIMQVQMYMWLAQYDETRFLFFNKNSSDMISFSVSLNMDIVNAVLTKVKLIRDGIKNRELPQCFCAEKEHDHLVLKAPKVEEVKVAQE